MKIQEIIITQKYYKIITNQSDYLFPKNEPYTQLIELLKPALEQQNTIHNMLIPQLLHQFDNVAQLNQWMKQQQVKFTADEFDEIMLRLEEAYYFIYDIMKLFEVEIPPSFFIQKE